MYNFTSDKNYRLSLYYRFPVRNISSSDNIDIIRYYDGKNCFQYFDFHLNENDVFLINKINKNYAIKFRNINKNSKVFSYLNSKYNLKINCEWEAPFIKITKGNYKDYISSRSKNCKRLIKKCKKLSERLNIVDSEDNVLELWKDILYIDQNSWKRKEKTDMLNMYYEHISLLSLKKFSYITVVYIENSPIAYSLLYKYDNIYYASKWGATDIGRKNNAGIIALLHQIEKISDEETLNIDLFGRNNQIYDLLKTNSIKRVYFEIIKNGSKD
jgi:hypothetical protein